MNTISVITEERRAFLRKIGQRGGLKRAESFTSEFQRKARACVSHESNVANGRKGGIAYVKKYGARRLTEQARQYRLAHPSDLERIIEGALIAMGARDYERERFIFPRSHCQHITGDFVFRKAHKVVYADGTTWHTNNALAGERYTRDERFDQYLRGRGWRILRLTQDEIHAYERGDGGTMLRKIKDFLETKPTRQEASTRALWKIDR